MKTIHLIAGLPRAGSTLLCNVLCQNPRFYASATSPLLAILRAIGGVWQRSPEILNQIEDYESWEPRFRATILGTMQGWYSCRKEPVIFDKSRGWTTVLPFLERVLPNAKLILCVRDLRDVVASVDRQACRTALYPDDLPMQMRPRVDAILQRGVLTGPLNGLRDVLDRGWLDRVFIWWYEEFCYEPLQVMKRLYEYIGEEYYLHDFTDIKKANPEHDGVYKFTYPHEGRGPVTTDHIGKWIGYLPQEVADSILERYAWFYRSFLVKKEATDGVR